MSKIFQFPVQIVHHEHVSGLTLSTLPQLLDSDWLMTPWELCQKFEREAQDKLLQQGKYLECFRYLTSGKATIEIINVPIPAMKDKSAAAHTIAFQGVVWENSEVWYAAIPALGVGCKDESQEGALSFLADCAKLKLQRDKRLKTCRSLIPLQWFDKLGVSEDTLRLEVYTPNEIAELQRQSEEAVVPKTARRMGSSYPKTFGMDRYLEDLQRCLLGEFKQSILVVGPSGCGKTALIQEFVSRYCPRYEQRPWQTSATQLIQALTESGGWQFLLGLWVKELREKAETVYVGNLRELFEVGQYSGNNSSLADALRDPLSRNEVLLIGEVTEEQLADIERRSSGYSQLFQIVRIADRPAEEEDLLARQAIDAVAAQHEVTVHPQAISRLTKLQRRYSPYSGYPGKLIRFFENLILIAGKSGELVTEEDAVAEFCEQTGMPRFMVDHNVPMDIDQVRHRFEQRLIGQREAIDALLDTLVTVKAGLASSGKPISSLLFIGPTGVGKTELAKTLAAFMFGDEKRLVRFDMSEYSDPIAVSRLTASHQASLVNRIRQQPFTVLLFDEIEKADAIFFDLLLQVLGEGRLTDDSGNLANFCSAMIIMTSNVGASKFMAAPLGFETSSQEHPESAGQHFRQVVEQYFRPELFNRIDQIIPFYPLSDVERQQVFNKELVQTQQLLGISNRTMQLAYSENIAGFLSQRPHDSRYGAREYQRLMQREVLSPLAEILSAKPHSASFQITGKLGDNTLSFDVQDTHGDRRQQAHFIDVADNIATLRHRLQTVHGSPRWLSLLSELDRLEALKRRKKENFWKQPKWVSRYHTLNDFKERLQKLLDQTKNLETEAYLQFVEQAEDRDASLFTATLEDLETLFIQVMLALESILAPDNNRTLLCLFGKPTSTDQLAGWYKRWFADLGHESKKFWMYISPPDDADLLYVITRQTSYFGEYYLTSRPLPHAKNQLVGIGWEIHEECVHDFWLKEAGRTEITIDDAKEAVMVDLSQEDLALYEPPPEIHRLKTVKEHKIQRRIEPKGYQDPRLFADKEYHPLEDHPALLREKALERILERYGVRQGGSDDYHFS